MVQGVADGSFAVIFRDNLKKEVFLIYRSDKPVWNLPGGGINKNETPEDAVSRETWEETGFTIRIVKKIGLYRNIDIHTKDTWNYAHLYWVIIKSGTYKPEYPGCKGKWFGINSLPKNVMPVTMLRILDATNSGEEEPFTKDFQPIT